MRKRLVSLFVLVAAPALADSGAGPVCRAARALERAQGNFGTARATWEWSEGSGEPAENAAGIIAVALAQSSPRCGAIETVQRYAEARLAQHEAGQFLFDGDVEALARASEVTGNAHYLAVAREAFDRRYSGASGREIVERWFWVRRGEPALVGFDGALAIRAAIAVGSQAKALEIADALVETRGRWSEHAMKFRDASRGAVLEALTSLDANRYAAATRDLMHHLVLAQADDGSWGHDTQATAYAVRGLTRLQDPAAGNAAALGRDWLKRTQLSQGAWSSFQPWANPHNVEVIPEVTAETMLALE